MKKRRIGPEDVQNEVDREIRFHIEMRAREFEVQGMAPEEARKAAEAAFGDVSDVTAECRQQRTRRNRARRARAALGDLRGDLRFAVRMLSRERFFAAAAIFVLAVGLALTVAAAAVVNAYLVRGLPFPASDRLVFTVGEGAPDWRDLPDFLEVAFAWDLDALSILGESGPERAWTSWVSPGFFPATGARVQLGRTFGEAEAQPGGPAVAVISHGLWQRRWGGDPSIIGRTFSAYSDDRPDEAEVFTVIGVLSPDFWYMSRFFEVLAPLQTPRPISFARLAPGVTPAAALERLERIARERDPDRATLTVRSAHEAFVESVRPSLIALAGAVALVLAIACGNASVLLLVRASARTREFTIRSALGAGRLRIARQLVAEGLVLAAAATATGLLLGWLLLRLLAGIVPRFLGTPVPGGSAALAIDGGVALIVTAICAAAGLLFGLTPLATAARRNLAGSLIEGGRGTDGVARQRLRSALVSLELALSLALLIGAGLLIRSAGHLQQRELGFTADDVIAFDISLRRNRYPDAAARAVAYQRMLEQIERDVQGMQPALASFAPFSRVGAGPVETPESPVTDDGNSPMASGRVVSPSFFDLLEVPLVSGRAFSELDVAGAEPVAIVSRDLAERLWPNGNAVGQRVRAASLQPGAQPQPWRTVVGVAGEVVKTLTEANPPDLYVPMAQAGPVLTELIVRDAVPLTPARIDAVRRAIWTVDPEVPLNLVRNLSEDVRTALLPARFLAAVLGSFAVFAVILATFGLYGVIAYTVNRRRREIALRMALGAGTNRVVRLFLQQGLPLVLVGVAAGLLVGFALTRVLTAQLHGVSAADPATWAIVTAILTIAALLAIAVPALRATRRQLMRELREEG